MAKKVALTRDEKRAAARYKRFTGHDPVKTGTVNIPPTPKAVVAIGYLDSVSYETMRHGRIQRFRHVFAKHARPLFVASPDGRQLLMLGGAFRFTERGIVDAPRRKRT